jgi:hypothetical protein
MLITALMQQQTLEFIKLRDELRVDRTQMHPVAPATSTISFDPEADSQRTRIVRMQNFLPVDDLDQFRNIEKLLATGNNYEVLVCSDDLQS